MGAHGQPSAADAVAAKAGSRGVGTAGEAQGVQGGGAAQWVLGTVAILDAGRYDVDRQEQAEGVGDKEPFAAFELLACIEAPYDRRDGVRGAGGSRVGQPGGRFRTAALGRTDSATESFMIRSTVPASCHRLTYQ